MDERVRAAASATGSLAAEGLAVGPEAQAVMDRWERGEVTTEEMRDEVRGIHRVRGEYEERGRTDLVKAIMGVLPIDPDGQCIVFVGAAGHKYWGDPSILAHRILDALDEAYTNRDLQHEFAYMRHEEEDPF